jgi:hypothetical protein
MCTMIYAPPGKTPARQRLEAICRIHPDGYGATVLVAGLGLVSVKTMDSIAAIEAFMTLRGLYPDSHAVFHARYATGDNITEANIQPIATDDGDVAHNGYLFPVTDDDRSDTRIFAEELLAKWDLDDDDQWQELCRILGNNKVILLTDSARYAQSVYIMNAGLGIWEPGDGCWYSNADYAGGKGHRQQAIDDGRCVVCGSGRMTDAKQVRDARICKMCDVLAGTRRQLLEGGPSWSARSGATTSCSAVR